MNETGNKKIRVTIFGGSGYDESELFSFIR